MPEMTPVGTMYPPANPVSQLSSILGVQQQQQNLQTGAIQQQTAQAESTQKQQQSAELQAAQSVIKNGVAQGRYTKADGSFDRMKASDDIAAVAPTYGQGISNQLLSGANEVLANKQALQNLNQSQRAQIGGLIQSLASDKDVTNTKVIGAMKGLMAQNPGSNDVAQLVLSNLTHMPATGKSSDLQEALGQMASGLNGEPASSPTTIDNGPSIVPGAVNKYTGAFTPAGAPIKKGLGPTDQIPYKGAVANVTAGGSARGGGSGSADIDASNMVVGAQKDARTNIDLTKRIDQLADLVQPGALASKVSQGLGALGLQDVNQARTELAKDLGRLRGSVAARAGSDSRASEVLSGLPTETTPTDTIHQAMDVTRGSARQDLALGKMREKSASASGGNMNGFQGEYAHAVASASPLMHEYYSLSPQEQVGFFKRNFKTADEARAFRANAETVKKKTPDVAGQ